jgi:hypothetical protein
VTEDRFDDLRGDGDGRRSAGERLAERDRTHPEPGRRPEVPRPGNKYAWAVGIVMVMILGVVLFAETLPNSGEGLMGLKRGQRAPDFAAPLATSDLEGDANVCRRKPCPEGSGPRPACEIHSKEVLTSCDLTRRPAVLTFIFDRGADCFPQVDRTERVKGSVPGVSFATVYFTHHDRKEVQNLARARRWTQPVGIDRDGQVVNLYRVGGCPTTMFLRAGGLVASTRLGNLTEDQIRRGAERLTG